VQKEGRTANWSPSTMKTFGWDSPNFLAIWRQILDGSCSTAAIMELHTVRGVICILHFLSHGHNAAIVGTLQRLDDVGQDNVRWFPMHRRQLDYDTHIGLRACLEGWPEYSSWVYSAIRSQLACAANVSPIHLTVGFMFWKCYPISRPRSRV
jgi:hypothetical protein